MRIYALDDEELALAKLTYTFKSLYPSLTPECFTEVAAFQKAMEKAPADVVFMDIRMPGTSGSELAAKILKENPRTNMIFLSGYSKYKSDAIDMFASGYIVKPVTKEKLKQQMENLRHPVASGRFRAVAFGNFTFYADGKPVAFHRNKSLEILAYLVDRCGAVVPRTELSLELFGDPHHTPQTQILLKNACYTLITTLKAANADEVIYRGADGLAVRRDHLTSDLFEYYEGATNLYQGSYMEQFPWGKRFKIKADKK